MMLACPSRPLPVRIGDRDAAKLAAVDALDSVMLGEALIEEGVIRGQQIDDAAILAQRAFDQQLGFLLERLTQVLVEVRKGCRIRLYSRDIAQEQPLAGEVRSPAPASADRPACAGPGASRTAGSPSSPRSATASSSSSGMLLHRKKDRRDASSTSLIR